MSLEAHYSDYQTCMSELRQARALFCSDISDDQWDGLDRGLAFLIIYCPPEIKDLAMATLQESIARRNYYRIRNM